MRIHYTVFMALLTSFLFGCKTNVEPDAIAPGMRATIDGVHWSTDSAHAIARDPTSNCMTIYGFTSGQSTMLMLTCFKTVQTGDSVMKTGSYRAASGASEFAADSGSMVILKRSADKIQGRFWFRARPLPQRQTGTVMVTEGEFNVPLNTKPY